MHLCAAVPWMFVCVYVCVPPWNLGCLSFRVGGALHTMAVIPKWKIPYLHETSYIKAGSLHLGLFQMHCGGAQRQNDV